MKNIPKMKVGVVAVSRDCFPESLSVNRRKALMAAYEKKYGKGDLYECPGLQCIWATSDLRSPRRCLPRSFPSA